VETLRRIGDIYKSNNAEEEAQRAWQEALNLSERQSISERITATKSSEEKPVDRSTPTEQRDL
jgi:predicted negative regulator of RcsB-dependent stress response